MQQYHKIDNLFKRDNLTNKVTKEFSKIDYYYLQDCSWIASEKIDGTNIRVMWDGQKITYGGKTDKAVIPPNLLTKLESIFSSKMDIFREKFADKNVIIFGEGYGGKIQGNQKIYGDNENFIVFDIMINDIFLERGNVKAICEMFKLEIVPTITTSSINKIILAIKEKNIATLTGEGIIEGLVCRPAIELKNRLNERIIFKIKTKDF